MAVTASSITSMFMAGRRWEGWLQLYLSFVLLREATSFTEFLLADFHIYPIGYNRDLWPPPGTEEVAKEHLCFLASTLRGRRWMEWTLGGPTNSVHCIVLLYVFNHHFCSFYPIESPLNLHGHFPNSKALHLLPPLLKKISKMVSICKLLLL